MVPFHQTLHPLHKYIWVKFPITIVCFSGFKTSWWICSRVLKSFTEFSPVLISFIFLFKAQLFVGRRCRYFDGKWFRRLGRWRVTKENSGHVGKGQVIYWRNTVVRVKGQFLNVGIQIWFKTDKIITKKMDEVFELHFQTESSGPVFETCRVFASKVNE